MQFWIDRRSSHSQLQQLYGRRRRPDVFYGGRLSGRDKGPGHHGNSLSYSSTTNPPPLPVSGGSNPQQQSSSSAGNSSNNSMVTPVHRFHQTSEQAQLACLNNLAAAGTTGGSTSPSNHRSRAYSNGSNRLSSGHSSTTTRSRSRSHSRERRSSSLRRTPSHLSSDPGSTPMPDYSHHLTSASLTSTEISDPKWTRTKRIGLTLCFMAFILLCTVAAKFIIEGPSLIDSSRRHPASTDTSFFFITELVFVAFAMVLFFSGVHCLRSRTNRFLMRAFQNQINQNLSAATRDGIPVDGFGLNNNSGSDYFDSSTQEDDENLDNVSSGGHHHHHHHHVLHSGNVLPGGCFYHSPTTFRSNHHHHHRNSTLYPDIVIGRHHHHDRHHHTNSQPPPYHIALYLPLPSQDYEDGIKDQCTVKCSDTNGARTLDNGKDMDPAVLATLVSLPPTEGNSQGATTTTAITNNTISSTTAITNNNTDNTRSTSTNEQQTRRDGAETPPPSYEYAFKKNLK